ncbi:hypothetical protein [Rhodopirellula sp. MGV]|uniref:hypothetical protein n=1 Tax=Rhodopirellula sp. MGV TaxID=2023130 RepID=UPI000B962760|nr:hypothetical protein [Rhodopirellula sp. MGV]OYP29952.1 hypothetical protein CGZ80_23295 [Rhodopirellula sp. MGV]PNY33408.1 hypothetical protein C2E31_28310 [Rhodopirellula baltica]
MTSYRKRIIGLAFWTSLAAAALGIAYVTTRSSTTPRSGDDETPVNLGKANLASVAGYLIGAESTVVRIDAQGRLKKGDPIFLAIPNQDGQAGSETNAADSGVAFRQVGHVAEPAAQPGGEVRLVWYGGSVASSGIDPEACQMFRYRSTGRLSEVVEVMFPPEKQRLIRDRLTLAMKQHGEELARSLTPLVEQTFRKSLPLIEDSFRDSVASHRVEIERLGRRWNQQMVEKRLIPLAKKEILPIVQKHGRPPAEEVGREIWDRASLFRFGWRAIYDKSPLPQKDLLRQEWQRFVDEDAVPILESHMDEIVVAIQRTLTDVSNNSAVRREVTRAANELASDPETRKLVQVILKEAIVENERLKQLWREIWTSDEATTALELASQRLEPVIRSIGDDLFGNEEMGINPDFARVLRSQILREDRQWVIAWHTGANDGVIETANDNMPYPVVYIAETEE